MSVDKEKGISELAFGNASSSCGTLNHVLVGQSECTTGETKSQGNTYSEANELKSKFTPKKNNSLLLAASYKRLNMDSKSDRVSECGSFLSFAHALDDGIADDKGFLHNANFCRDRLCPMCAWRRSYKIFGQVSQIMDKLGNSYKYLFITLTVPNCAPNSLSRVLDDMLKAWHRFTNYKDIKAILKGYFRALEITRNKQNGSFHPHFHVVFAVPRSYGSKLYLSHDRLLQLWRKATRDDSITQVDIRLCKDKNSDSDLQASSDLRSAVAEIAKYVVKDSDYITEDNSVTDCNVFTLTKALYHRRLIQFGGIFKETFKNLKLEDIESDSVDLVHINEKINPQISYLIVHYGWNCGVYQIINTTVLCPTLVQEEVRINV